ncbi:helix-turn-helix domain-containing protein [Humisphaera borealis]|uniref:DNA binding HTH domain-containing protein n=1 Tax=Humisphaera borealis TaxID=2807512 RepID=A0A7M2WYK1_9BACT|nr:hypothetical protein IPV69_26040 [Humisphaera borealis]
MERARQQPEAVQATTTGRPLSLEESRQVETVLIREALARTGGDFQQMSRLLGISQKVLRAKVSELGLS